MYKIVFVLLIGSIITAGCATTQSVTVEDRSRTFDAPLRSVFKGIVQTFTVEGYPVDYVDRKTGLISTGYKYERRFLDDDRRTRVNAYLDAVGDGQTRVTLLLSVEEVGEHGRITAEPMLGSLAREMYQELLDEIGARLRG